jgi:Flp pilus assembly protein TadD
MYSRNEEALADLSRAIEISSTPAGVMASRGLVYEAMGRAEEALADYNYAIQLDPNLSEPLHSLSDILPE